MSTHYIPTENELAMAEMEHLLRRSENDLTTQEGIVASLVHDIYNFDYYYHFSDDLKVWRNGEEKKESIRERLDEVEDAQLREALSSHFTVERREEILTLVPWGEYHRKATKYVYLRWDGYDDQKARQLVELRDEIEGIAEDVRDAGTDFCVLYANDIMAATKILREEVRWHHGELLGSAAVPDALYERLTRFVTRYRNNEICYADFKSLYVTNVDCSFLMGDDGWTIEIIKLRNFYFMVIE